MILYRLTHPDYPFLWETGDQPPARWHDQGQGPVHYFATTPEGAWAEILRHEEIKNREDLKGLRGRAMWVVRLEQDDLDEPKLAYDVITGPMNTYPACRAEAKRLRDGGSRGLHVTSAALMQGGALRYTFDGGPRLEPLDSEVVVIFGSRPDVSAQLASLGGHPHERVFERVRHFTD